MMPVGVKIGSGSSESLYVL